MAAKEAAAAAAAAQEEGEAAPGKPPVVIHAVRLLVLVFGKEARGRRWSVAVLVDG